ncbi:MAG: CAP domain-containing protein [bacterium]|nr:CAP domain-containing protein [bacterium]
MPLWSCQEARADVVHPVHDIVVLTNQERLKHSLTPLSVNSQLTQAAHNKAADMLANNYFDHISPDGRQAWNFIDSAGYPYVYAGENLAINFHDPFTTIQGWMDSPGHRENLLYPHFQEIGIATHSGQLNGQPVTLTVQMFGSRDDYQATRQILRDAQETPQQTEALVDARDRDWNGSSGYVASAVSLTRISENYYSGESAIQAWLMVSSYGSLLVLVLFWTTSAGLRLKVRHRLVKAVLYSITPITRSRMRRALNPNR